jgi:hypothetical protein
MGHVRSMTLEDCAEMVSKGGHNDTILGKPIVNIIAPKWFQLKHDAMPMDE